MKIRRGKMRPIEQSNVTTTVRIYLLGSLIQDILNLQQKESINVLFESE